MWDKIVIYKQDNKLKEINKKTNLKYTLIYTHDNKVHKIYFEKSKFTNDSKFIQNRRRIVTKWIRYTKLNYIPIWLELTFEFNIHNFWNQEKLTSVTNKKNLKQVKKVLNEFEKADNNEKVRILCSLINNEYFKYNKQINQDDVHHNIQIIAQNMSIYITYLNKTRKNLDELVLIMCGFYKYFETISVESSLVDLIFYKELIRLKIFPILAKRIIVLYKNKFHFNLDFENYSTDVTNQMCLFTDIFVIETKKYKKENRLSVNLARTIRRVYYKIPYGDTLALKIVVLLFNNSSSSFDIDKIVLVLSSQKRFVIPKLELLENLNLISKNSNNTYSINSIYRGLTT